MNTRRTFLAAGLVGAGSLACSESLFAQQQEADKPQPIAKELVSKFVGRSHGDFETVKKLVKENPLIVNACWDWGDGDFETGLGAASHVGRRDIAEFLLENGARMDLFAATMLGIEPIVAESLKVFPKVHAVPGPHQIPLLSHAIYGKEQADEVFELLIRAGANVNAQTKNKMTPLMAAAQVGRPAIVQALLNRNADPTVESSKGATAVSLAKKRGHEKVAQMISAAIKKRQG